MIQDPNPTDYPEVEKFCEWLYTDSTAHLHNFEQLKQAFSVGLNACHSRDGGVGAELHSLRNESTRFHALLGRMIDDLKSIEANELHKAKAADIRINAPKALMQQALSAQASLLRALLDYQQDFALNQK